MSNADRTKRYRERHPERSKASSQKYRAAHLEKDHARKQAWNKANKDRYNQTAVRYRESDKGKASMRRGSSRRRAIMRSAFVEDVDAQIVYQTYGGMCGICKEFIEGDFHVDHIKPLSKGGLHCYANCQPAHPKCNLLKGSD